MNPWLKSPSPPSKMSVEELLNNIVNYGKDPALVKALKNKPIEEVREVRKKLTEQPKKITEELVKLNDHLKLLEKQKTPREKVVKEEEKRDAISIERGQLNKKLFILNTIRKEV